MSYILAIDQSTAGTKAVLFNKYGAVISRSDLPHRQIVDERGWVEHDPVEIITNVNTAAKQVVEQADILPEEIKAIGLSNQRETVVCWDRETGQPVYNAIVWQCGRAAPIADALAPYARLIREKTGLNNSPFFSAPKMAWVVQNVPRAAELLEQDRLCCGTIDTWLVYTLTDGQSYKTDFSNASRTELMNLDTLDWDDSLIEMFGLRRSCLPEIVPSDHLFGMTDFDGLFPQKIPIAAVLGDSHAALFANGCFAEGMTKATFGTGTSVMMNAGASRPKQVPDGLVESVSWGRGGEVFYALEGNINYSGALIKWLVNDLELIRTSRESGQFAMQVKDTGGVYFVPAFSGLGAPYWDNDARAMICGITAATKKAHLVRAAEEAIAYQIRDITEQLALCGKTVGLLCVDGGATNDQFLMQFVSDMTGAPLKRSSIEELSAAGAAYMAALSAGIATQTEIFSSIEYTQVEPSMQQTQRERLYKGWKKAVAMVTEKKR